MARKSITSLSAENESLRNSNTILFRNTVVFGDILADIDKALTGKDNSMSVWPEFPSMIVDLKHALSQEREANAEMHEQIVQLRDQVDSLIKLTSDLTIQLNKAEAGTIRDLEVDLTASEERMEKAEMQLAISMKNNRVLIKANMRQSGVIDDMQCNHEDDERKLRGVAIERDVLMEEVEQSRKFLHDYLFIDPVDIFPALAAMEPLLAAQEATDVLFPKLDDDLGIEPGDAIIRDIHPASTGTRGPIL